MAAITVSDDALGRAVSLISAYCGDPAGKPAQGASTSVKTADGAAVTGLAACATALAAASPAAADLLGRTPAEAAAVAEWLTHCATELALLLDDKLASLNKELAARTFLVGGRLTLADLAVYGTLQPAVAAMPPAQTDQFCSLLRWFDLLQHTADPAQAVFKHRALPLPRFVPPPPPQPPQPSAGKEDKGGKGSDASSATKGGAAAAAAAAPSSSSSKAAPAKGGAPAAAAAAAPAAAAAAAEAAPEAAAPGGKKAAKKDKAAAAGGAAEAPKKADEEVGIDALDIRVGQIVAVGRHPNADALYLEEIDLGEGKPRQVISGLVKFVPEEAMRGRRVVVVTNLKPAKMRDVMSYGMVLCASNDAHDAVDPVVPPEGVPLGERISVEGYGGEPLAEGVPFMTSKGPVTSTIPNAHVG
ncbi:hypothetical protein Rsub_08529 [Raphidocelis subcapitata]|uniref:tRNA-binding domain-containing protein n=1 Tax=Raphidocelis subcapitata TaxID=307507 RepID=A0A2V0P6R2_9CHLO|nr:hypothetical protein Rsub_08529 [Raphidocelis subcapitata]|eukprot:GBF95548.1 hypothetical protein Rsub_08529 [Raphidocelis subcapitata]